MEFTVLARIFSFLFLIQEDSGQWRVLNNLTFNYNYKSWIEYHSPQFLEMFLRILKVKTTRKVFVLKYRPEKPLESALKIFETGQCKGDE